ncbi:MAG: hypothetical protein ABJE47_10375 [bacterium]
MLVQRSQLPNNGFADTPPVLRAADAYRADVASRSLTGQFGPPDGQWIALANMLSHVDSSMDALPWTLVDELLDALTPLRQLHLEPPEPVGATAADIVHERGRRIRLVAEEMENAGALELADVVLASYCMAEPVVASLDQGRCLAQRGRLRWKLGDAVASHTRYRETERIGKRCGSDELVMRAWIGYAVLARLRGNYPDCRRWTERAIRMGERRAFKALTGLAHHVAMVSAAVARDFGAAVVHGWTAFLAADGDPAVEGDALVNLAQAMLDAGHTETARAGFAASLSRSTASRHLLPALGGYALACARMRDADEVHHTVAMVLALEETGSPYATACAHLECASALRSVGDQSPRVAALCARAAAIAEQYGFHEIVAGSEVQERAQRVLRSTSDFTDRQHEMCLAIEALASAHPLMDAGNMLVGR